MAVQTEAIFGALRECYDPEIPINIVDLGLIYEVAADEAGSVVVRMTLTSPSCPSAMEIPEQVRQKISAIAKVKDVKVEVVWEPQWDPSRISTEGRKILGIEV
jgi:FeS assembly SUF system protein